MVEGARLESVYMGNCIGGSNPPVSAAISHLFSGGFFVPVFHGCKHEHRPAKRNPAGPETSQPLERGRLLLNIKLQKTNLTHLLQ